MSTNNDATNKNELIKKNKDELLDHKNELMEPKHELMESSRELTKSQKNAMTPIQSSIEQMPDEGLQTVTAQNIQVNDDINKYISTYIDLTKQLKEKMQARKPLVHHITNFVTIYQCARITSFLGASPVMAFSAAEAAEVTAVADALVINTGTLNDEFIKSIPISLATAKAHHIPVVLDPVGINLSDYRHDFIMDILQNHRFSVLRCNGVELLNVYGKLMRGSGIDGSLDNAQENASANNPSPSADRDNIHSLAFSVAQAAKDIAQKYHCTVACTGKTDVISDGVTTLYFSRGSDLLPKLVGTGCMMNSLIASFLPVAASPLEAATAGILTMSLASEAAEARLESPNQLGSFETYLLDAIR